MKKFGLNYLTTMIAGVFKRRRRLTLAAVAVAAAFVMILVSAVSPAGSATAPSEAAAGNVPTLVNVLTGNPVQIDCNYGKGPYYWLYPKADADRDGKGGKQFQSVAHCIDADRIFSSVNRCMRYMGVGAEYGWYLLPAGKYKKIASLSITDITRMDSRFCTSKTRVFPNI